MSLTDLITPRRKEERQSVTLTLYLRKPDPDLTKAMKTLSPSDIQALMRPAEEYLRGRLVRTDDESFLPTATLINKMISSGIKSMTKLQLIKIYLAIGSDARNLVILAESFPALREVCMRMLPRPYFPAEEFEALLGHPADVRCKPYDDTAFPFTEFPFALAFPIRRSDKTTSLCPSQCTAAYFEISGYCRTRLAQALLGEDCLKAAVTKELPEGEHLRTVGFEYGIAADIEAVAKAGMDKSVLTPAGTLPMAKAIAMASSIELRPLPQHDPDFPLDRGEMLVQAYYRNPDHADCGFDVMRFARYVAQDLPEQCISGIFSTFLPAYTGFTRTWTQKTNLADVVEIVHEILAPAADGWMPLHNLSLRYLCGGPHKYSFQNIFWRKFKITLQPKQENDGAPSDPKDWNRNDWYSNIDFPFIIHWLQFLCAAGLLEIAFTEEITSGDPLERIRYVRLTPLGKYALRLVDDYDTSAIDADWSIDFDDERAIIAIYGHGCPHYTFFRRIGRKISPNRFLVTPATLLQTCENRRDVKDTIDKLESIVDMAAHPALGRIAEQALQQTGALIRTLDGYRIVSLTPDIPGLRALIDSDTTLRANLILAEQNIAIMKEEFFSTFLQILKQNGYIPD